eukprot:1707134-Karenia_brevis.AAC.1
MTRFFKSAMRALASSVPDFPSSLLARRVRSASKSERPCKTDGRACGESSASMDMRGVCALPPRPSSTGRRLGSLALSREL